MRLGLGLLVLWFVFWTFAHVMRPHRSDNEPPPETLFTLTTQIALVFTAAIVGPWMISGFRPDANKVSEHQ